jgi:hypothetical protein
MAHRHIFQRSRITRSGFAFALLLLAELGCASLLCAQDDALSVSPMPEMESIGDAGLRAYVAGLPSAPTPKIEPAANASIEQQQRSLGQISPERSHQFYWLDRRSLTYGLVQGGAEIFDGATTRYFIHHCSHCYEDDPMSRLLMGKHPTWGKMIPMGIGEAAFSAYSYRRMSRSPNRFLRGAAPLVPLGLTAIHMIEGARNIGLKNRYRCADAGYVVAAAAAGAVCVPAPPSVLTAAPVAIGGGPGSRRDPM